MSSLTGLRFLRPYLYHDILPVKPAAYARLFSTHYSLRSERFKRPDCETQGSVKVRRVKLKEGLDPTETRIKKLQLAGALHYPRIKKVGKIASVKSCLEKCAEMLPGVDSDEAIALTLHGKKPSSRQRKNRS